MAKKLLAIGVSSVEPVDGEAEDFPYLDGAIVAAETLGQWAIKSGFAANDVKVLTDKGADRVTDQAISEALDELLPPGTVTEHLILTFAGHGLTGLNDDITYWLMSDSLQEGYQIFVEDLKRLLYFYGIERLTIFSDACRAIANTRNLQTLISRPGARRRHGARTDLELARYNACQDATSAFMVREIGAAAPGKCIFSGVLAEALWGRVPEAFDGDVIDSASLGRGLKKAVKVRAAHYNQTLAPSGNPFFDRVIYYDRNTPPHPPEPDLPPWPPAGAAQPIHAGPGAGPGLVTSSAEAVFAEVLGNADIRNEILGQAFGEAHPDIDTAKAFPGLPRTAKSIVADVAVLRQVAESTMLPRKQAESVTQAIERKVAALEGLAASRARQRKASSRSAAIRRIDRADDARHAHLASNAPIKAIWSEGDGSFSSRGLKRFTLAGPRAPRLLMLEFADGLFAPIFDYPNLLCRVVRDNDGVAVISYRPTDGPEPGSDEVASVAARLVTGKLSAAELDRLATELRHAKHANPMFGAIAAYCYDLTGDLDSIARMAFYYARRNQPVPYDIAFMGMLENDGQIARVPAVGHDRRRREPDLPRWLVAETEATTVPIAGRCPWLRQGWDFVAAPEDRERPLVRWLEDVRRELQPAIFTTLSADGGRFLANRWGMQPWQQD